jgi:hypothetical protein
LDVAANGTALPVTGERLRFHEIAQNFSHEQRASLGIPSDRARQGELVLVEFVTDCGDHEVHDAFFIEAAHGNSLDAGFAAKVGEHRGQSGRPRQLAVPIGPDDQKTQRHCRAHDVFEQQQFRRACPLQIVEYEHDGALL